MSEYGQAKLYWADYFEREVRRDYGADVSIIQKSQQLIKFGRSDLGGVDISTLWSQGGNEVFLSDNTITKLTCAVASTTTIVVEGHTVDGDGDFTGVVQTITLNGLADVALPIPLARCSRLYNDGGAPLTGDVSARTAADVVYCNIPAGSQQSFKAATTISKDVFFGMNGFQVAVSKKTAATAEFQMEIRLKGKVFRSRDLMVAASPGSTVLDIYQPWLVIPPNSDIRIRTIASGNSTPVAGSFEGLLASVL
jgi:hypothetical protein